MKKKILILIAIFCVQTGFTQQFPLQSQYQFNYSSINPAAVGEYDYLKMVASYRNQWAGFNTQNDQFTKTCSGQTQGKLINHPVLCMKI